MILISFLFKMSVHPNPQNLYPVLNNDFSTLILLNTDDKPNKWITMVFKENTITNNIINDTSVIG